MSCNSKWKGSSSGNTDDSLTIYLDCELYSAKDNPVHSWMLSSHLFCLSLHLHPGKVPCKMIFARTDDFITCLYIIFIFFTMLHKWSMWFKGCSYSFFRPYNLWCGLWMKYSRLCKYQRLKQYKKNNEKEDRGEFDFFIFLKCFWLVFECECSWKMEKKNNK